MEGDEAGVSGEVTFTPLTNHIGSKVSGVDLTKSLSDCVFAQIQQQLFDRSVLIFNGQNWTPEEHVEFSKRFGPLEDHVLSNYCLPNHPKYLLFLILSKMVSILVLLEGRSDIILIFHI